MLRNTFALIAAIAVLALTFTAGAGFAHEEPPSNLFCSANAWCEFPDRFVYAVFGAAVGFALMAVIVRFGGPIIAPGIRAARRIANLSREGLAPSDAEARLASGIFVSTSIRVAAVMFVVVVFAVLL